MSTGKIRRLDLWWLRDSQQVPPQAKRAPCIPYPPTLKPHSPLLRWLRAPADGRHLPGEWGPAGCWGWCRAKESTWAGKPGRAPPGKYMPPWLWGWLRAAWASEQLGERSQLTRSGPREQSQQEDHARAHLHLPRGATSWSPPDAGFWSWLPTSTQILLLPPKLHPRPTPCSGKRAKSGRCPPASELTVALFCKLATAGEVARLPGQDSALPPGLLHAPQGHGKASGLGPGCDTS